MTMTMMMMMMSRLSCFHFLLVTCCQRGSGSDHLCIFHLVSHFLSIPRLICVRLCGMRTCNMCLCVLGPCLNFYLINDLC
jgi:hypothetical protein